MHHPVLLQTVNEQLAVKKGGLYIDATAGEGNLIEEILKQGGRVLAFDWDKEQINRLRKKFEGKTDLILVNENFAKIYQIALQYQFYPVDGVIFDLGLSAGQLERSGKGFSFKKVNEPLDMRINSYLPLSAADILNRLSFFELDDAFCRFGEDINTKKIVQAIVEKRKIKPIEKVSDLTEIVDTAIERKDEKTYRRIFQALRIMVNHELENLEDGLVGATKIITNDGKIIVISFHSVESRIIKRFIKSNRLKELSKKAIKGERSSQLRIFTKQSSL
jgi:16S rRNA (cytosine1402-N4)-methyltransferase